MPNTLRTNETLLKYDFMLFLQRSQVFKNLIFSYVIRSVLFFLFRTKKHYILNQKIRKYDYYALFYQCHKSSKIEFLFSFLQGHKSSFLGNVYQFHYPRTTATGMDGPLPNCNFENLKPVEILKRFSLNYTKTN